MIVANTPRRKPMALPGLVYRDQLFPRDAYRRLYDAAMAGLPEKLARRLTVNIPALAHDRGCEAELATLVTDKQANITIEAFAQLPVRGGRQPNRSAMIATTNTTTEDQMARSSCVFARRISAVGRATSSSRKLHNAWKPLRFSGVISSISVEA